MTELLVDIGNTNFKWARLNGSSRNAQQSVPHNGELPEAVVDDWKRSAKPTRILIANVAGSELQSQVSEWIEGQWSLSAEFLIASPEQLGVKNAYQNPAQLGIDRWLAILAAYHHKKSPVLVVDSGTAVTLDAVNGQGEHMGGLILPGIDMMRESLMFGTDMSDLHRKGYTPLLADNTATAVASGSVQSIAALIQHIISETSQQLGKQMELVMTGSGSTHLIPLLKIPVQQADELVLDGLALIARSDKQ